MSIKQIVARLHEHTKLEAGQSGLVTDNMPDYSYVKPDAEQLRNIDNMFTKHYQATDCNWRKSFDLTVSDLRKANPFLKMEHAIKQVKDAVSDDAV